MYLSLRPILSDFSTPLVEIVSKSKLFDFLSDSIGKEVVSIKKPSAKHSEGLINCEFSKFIITKSAIDYYKSESKSPSTYTSYFLNNIVDIVPINSVSHNTIEPPMLYTFAAFAGEEDEKSVIIHLDPVSAYLSAAKENKSNTQRLEAIEPITKGKVFHWHNYRPMM